MCIRDRLLRQVPFGTPEHIEAKRLLKFLEWFLPTGTEYVPVSYTHLRAHETVLDLVCRLLLEKKNKKISKDTFMQVIPPNV